MFMWGMVPRSRRECGCEPQASFCWDLLRGLHRVTRIVGWKDRRQEYLPINSWIHWSRCCVKVLRFSLVFLFDFHISEPTYTQAKGTQAWGTETLSVGSESQPTQDYVLLQWDIEGMDASNLLSDITSWGKAC